MKQSKTDNAPFLNKIICLLKLFKLQYKSLNPVFWGPQNLTGLRETRLNDTIRNKIIYTIFTSISDF